MLNTIEKRKIAIIALVLTLWTVLGLSASAQVAPDPTEVGPLATTSAEYQFPAALDPDIEAGQPTEVWAVVYRPADLSGGPYPVVIFLHGNHGTCGRGSNPRIDNNCQYTTTGTCPAGYVVVPNHAGYEYVADRLASWGYVVVSINVNRGINCRNDGPAGDRALNLARGRMVLKHLQKLSEWNTGAEPTPPSLEVDLTGKLDLGSSALVGHSRGGEGMRAAYNLYRDAGSPWPDRIPEPVSFQGIFEIGAVDRQTSRTLNADGTVWNQLLPMCDGDVSNLQGVRPFDRMMRIFDEDPATQKSTFTVWGANHNFYNTEWQQSDSPGCIGHERLFPPTMGSPEQRLTGQVGMMALVRGNVGPSADPTFNQNFNPQFTLPDVVTSVTRIDRGYTDSPHSSVTTFFEDFGGPTGTSSYGFPNDHSNITINHGAVPNHDPVQRAGLISWELAGSDTYFQTNAADVGSGMDISAFRTLDFRVSRQCATVACAATHPLNPADPTSFSIRLVMANDTLSQPVQLNSYTDLTGPVGGVRGGLHPILQTARILLTDFAGADLMQVRGVRLTFDGTATGAIYVANIRLSSLSGLGATQFPANGGVSSFQSLDVQADADTSGDGNVIKSIRSVLAAQVSQDLPGVEIELTSSREFPVRNELAVLVIGGRQFVMSRFPNNGDTHTLIFALTAEEFDQLGSGEEVLVQYGRDGSGQRWNFGRLEKELRDQQ